MSNTDNWLVRYEESHTGIQWPGLYWLAAPMIILGLIGLLWNLPVPAEFARISPLLNWGSTFLMVATIYYFIISLSLAIGLLPFLLGLAAVHLWLKNSAYDAMIMSGILFAAGVLFVMVSRATRLRALLQDLQMIMIAPVWLLSRVYKRFEIPV